MKRNVSRMLLVAPLVLLAAACNKDSAVDTTHTTGATTQAPATPQTPPVAYDNTGRNAQDQSGALTPMDQGNSEPDLSTTQMIRKAIIDDEALSAEAKNVKIITNGGVVTLRGPVDSEAERGKIELMARTILGSDRVVDQIDIANKQ
jgi:hyperosmotically inducible periplasmic protein